MSEKLRITGGIPLHGEVTISGGKNAALAIIPAVLLADSPSVIENIPDINDVHVILEMLRWLGADVVFSHNTLQVDPRPVDKCNPPYWLAARMRASYYLIPALLGRFHEAHVPLPGGCDIGSRPIDLTEQGLRMMGAEVNTVEQVVSATCGQLHGADIYLSVPSVGATVTAC